MYILTINDHVVQIGDTLELEGKDGSVWKVRNITPHELTVDELDLEGNVRWSDMHIPLTILTDAPGLEVNVISIADGDYPWRDPNLAFKFREVQDEKEN